MKKRFLPALALALAAGMQAAALAEGAAAAPAVDLTPLLQAIVSLSVSLITAFLIPWLKARLSAEQRSGIAAAYRTIVCAAEQLYGAGRGAEKLDWAVRQLEERGLKVDRAALEAEVLRLKPLGALIREDETQN